MTPGPGIGSPDTQIGVNTGGNTATSVTEQPKVLRDPRDGLLKYEGVDFAPGKAPVVQSEMQHATPLHDIVPEHTLASQIAELEQTIKKEEAEEKTVAAEPVRAKSKSIQRQNENFLIRFFNLPTTIFNYLKQTLSNLVKRGPQQGAVQAPGTA